MTKHRNYIKIILLMILAFMVSAFFFLWGLVNTGILIRLKLVCTEEATGIVWDITPRRVSSLDPVETRYLREGEDQTVMRIVIAPGSSFDREQIYTNVRHGETEIIFDESDKLLVEEVCLVYKSDGTRELHFKTLDQIDTDDETVEKF